MLDEDGGRRSPSGCPRRICANLTQALAVLEPTVCIRQDKLTDSETYLAIDSMSASNSNIHISRYELKPSDFWSIANRMIPTPLSLMLSRIHWQHGQCYGNQRSSYTANANNEEGLLSGPRSQAPLLISQFFSVQKSHHTQIMWNRFLLSHLVT